ncbi:MAG: 4-hydroxybenzoate octaprenyltransferase [Gammaproteobacteria bacterium]|nr:4-hydroxybenzoate octaprenyltransferase [Gammaproteobacteria bacterium]
MQMNRKIFSFIQLARLDKPIGIYLLMWPSLLGLLLGANNSGSIDFKNYIIVIVGSVLVRSCGCVINDINDYKIDKLVARTANRPIAAGFISTLEAWIFFIILALSSIFLLTFTNPLTIKISIFFGILIMIYPLTKRFFVAPQFILGITFGSGCLISYSLQSSTFSLSLMVLYIGIIAWIISFDTYYALEDKEDDTKININSTAILWGKNAVKYAQILHLIFYISLVYLAIINKFSFYISFMFIGLIFLFFYQNRLIKRSLFLEAFKINNWVGLLCVMGFMFEIFFI